MTDPVHNDTYPAIDPLNADLSGKSVIVAGASRGIGRAIALSFAKAGASFIAIGARGDLTSLVDAIETQATKAKRSLPKILSIKFEISVLESVGKAAISVEKEFGKLDFVVNSTGILSGPLNIIDSNPEDWEKDFTVNVKGTYLITRAFLPLMLKGGDKQIVNVCSVGAHLVKPGLSSYQTSKLAQLRFTELVCAEYGDQDVVAFCIHPGNIPTDIVGGIEGISDEMKHVFVETPELPADTIVYLVNKKRSWLAGRYINCTWDMPQIMAMKEDIVRGDKLRVKLDI